MFYKVDSTRVTLREYSWGVPFLLWPIVLPIVWLMKLARLHIEGSPDDPNVERLAEHEVARNDLPPDMRGRFERLEAELHELGFETPVYHQWHDRSQHTQFHLATLRHSSGQAIGRLHHRHWNQPQPPRDYLYAMFVSEFDDGSCLVTTAGKADLLPPPNVTVQRLRGASATKLWAAHQLAVQRETLSKSLVSVRDERRMEDLIERFQTTLRDFHVDRGVFVPLPTTLAPDAETANFVSDNVADDAGMPVLVSEDAPVLDEQQFSVIEEIWLLQNKRGGWLGAIILLVVSMAVFVGAGAAQWDWKFALMLVPVLLLHESGHWLAMKVFGYRNLKMFFIPFFGAGVSGRSYNVAGWKKAVVALAGPLPGVWLAIVLGSVALFLEKPALLDLAVLTLILNSFNLLPIMPLDGGQNLHAVLFSRHPVLDIVFRAGAGLALIGGSFLLGDKFLMYLGAVMLFGLPLIFKTAKIVSKLRDEGLDTQASADERVPVETAIRIINELRGVLSPQQQQVKVLAKLTLDVFESLNSRPPGVFASFSLLAAHGGTFLMSLVFAIIFVVGKHGNLGDFVRQAANVPQQSYQCRSTERWDGADSERDPEVPRQTLIANMTDADAASASYRELTGRLPPFATATRFGQTLFVALPVSEDEARKQWLGELGKNTQQLVVANKDFHVTVRLSCLARNGEEAKALEEELNECLRGTGTMTLIPPWSSNFPVTAEHRRARQIYLRATKAEVTANDPQLKEIRKQMAQAGKLGDQPEMGRLIKRSVERLEEARKENHERLRAELLDQLSQEVLDRYEQIRSMKFDGKADDLEGDPQKNEALQAFLVKQTAAWRHLGELLGQIPLEGDQPKEQDKLELVHGGFVQCNGLLVSIETLSFMRIDRGLPRLAEWLCGKGCIDVKYAINNFGP